MAVTYGRRRASLVERRIEPDRSLIIYHFFTGLPAEIGKRPTVGLGEADAIRVMRLLKGSAKDTQRMRSGGF
jgi:hypothetical protein